MQPTQNLNVKGEDCKGCFQKHKVCLLCKTNKQTNTLLSPDSFKYIEFSCNKTQMPGAHLASFLCQKRLQYEQIRYHVIRPKVFFQRQKEK